MRIDIDTPYSPGWWLEQLAVMLHNRRAGRIGTSVFTRRGVEPARIDPGLDFLADYLRGDPPLREDIHSAWSAPFRQYLRVGRMNIAPKLVSSTTNRMGITDFRTASAQDELGDVEARNLMRRNKLRLKAREVHDNMLGLGYGYTITTPPDARRSWSLITAESPLNCITIEDPATGETIAGLKMFRDHLLGVDWAYLFLPGELWVARADVQSSTLFRTRRGTFALTDQWRWDEAKFDDVPGDRVAMVSFANKGGLSEVAGHLDTLDRINDKLFNEWWTGKIQAFRQRALEMPDEDEEVTAGTGDEESEDDPETMSDEDWSQLFTSAPDAMWKLPKGAKIWESAAIDVRPAVESIKAELQWLAFTASKPLHLITPDAANGSAEGASTQKEEHAFEIMDRQDRAESGWAETLSMAFEFQGMTERADVAQIEVIWGPTELLSWEERASAASQLNGIVPTEAIQTDVLGYAPADVVDRLRPLRNREQIYLTAAAPPVPTPAAPAGAA